MLIQIPLFKRILGLIAYYLKCKYIKLGLPPHPNIKKEPGYHAVIGTEIIELVKQGLIKTVKGINKIKGNNITFDNGFEGIFDTIILATGYKPNIDFLNENPKLDNGIEVISQKKLILVGYKYSSKVAWLQELRFIAKKTIKVIKKMGIT